MPAVMSSKQFDARTLPFRRHLLCHARAAVGPNDAPDLVQDTLTTAWTRIHTFAAAQEDQPALLAFLLAILHFRVNNFIRKQACHKETLLPALTIFELTDGPESLPLDADQWEAQRQELYRRVHKFALTPRQRECTLRWLGGESLKGIGQSLSTPVSAQAVCAIIKRVGKLLRSVDQEETTIDVRECITNEPAALTYLGQMQRDRRVRAEANQFALQLSVCQGRR